MLAATVAACAAPLIVPGNAVRAAAASGNRKRVLRVAHLTDIHVQPERGAGDGMAQCLDHVHDLDDPPQLILFGGDNIMDTFANTRQRGEVQWKLWHKMMQGHCRIPHKACIGNHDVWGWHKKHSQTTGKEPGWGKDWAIDELKLPGRYYSFDRSGWHFIVLDSTHPHPDEPDSYIACLDEQQHEWLAADLAEIPAQTPVLVLSHMPICSVTGPRPQDDSRYPQWQVSRSIMHVDARRVQKQFHKHGNVRLALSGHVHMIDRVRFMGTTYCCNGAVCGAWWKGDRPGCDEGYALIDLYDNGSFEIQYVAYNWRVRKV